VDDAKVDLTGLPSPEVQTSTLFNNTHTLF